MLAVTALATPHVAEASGWTIHITSPRQGEVVSTPEVLVRGTVSAPRGTGRLVIVMSAVQDVTFAKVRDHLADVATPEKIRLLGLLGMLHMVAVVEEGHFATLAEVNEGENAIIATLGEFDREWARDSVTVKAVAGKEGRPHLLPSPDDGQVPLTVQFSEVGAPQDSRIDLGFDGDGRIDISPATLEGVTHRYTKPGLFFPTMTVRSSGGETLTATAIVDVFPAPDVVGIWKDMKGALRRHDVEGALQFFLLKSRDRYREALTSLTIDLRDIDRILTDIRPEKQWGGFVDCEMLRTENGQTVSYQVQFSRDYDNVWRIQSF